jgi:serine/threonine protein kinase
MLEIDQILQSRYQLQKQLGRNAGRQTWLASDLENQETVVLKLLAFGEEVQWEDLKLFEREAQVLQQLSHPRIPKYRDYFSIDDRHLWFGLVQEYIPGESLRGLLDRGKKFTEAEIVAIAKQILQILTYLHELSPPVLHRDIKPSNLILGSDPQDRQIYLVDFGAVQDKASVEGKTFTVVGTYGYAPMEQFGGRAIPASDLYALGMTLVHLLTGIVPSELTQDDSSRTIFSDRTNANPTFVSWIDELIEPSLKKRPSSAKQALDLLETGRSKSENKTKISQPEKSKIKVFDSAESLIIEIYHPNFWTILRYLVRMLFFSNITGLFILGLVITFFGRSLFFASLIFFVPFIVISFVRFIQILLISFSYQRICFDEEQFGIEWWIFNFCYQRKKYAIQEIKDVFQSVKIDKDNKEKEMVTIQTTSQRLSFGIGLTGMECLWLAQKIKDWLGER